MTMQLSVKNKTLLFIATILILFSTILFFIVFQQQKNKLAETQKEYAKEVSTFYTKMQEHHDRFGLENSSVASSTFSPDEYIVSLYFTMKLANIVKRMEEFYSIRGALFERRDGIWSVKYEELGNNTLLQQVLQRGDFDTHILLHLSKGQYYAAYPFDIYDLKKNNIARVIFFKDITRDVQEYHENIRDLFFLLLASVVLLLTVIHFGFVIMIHGLEKEFAVIKQYKNMINENVKTASLDLSRKIIDVSDAFCMMSGYEKKELLGKKYHYLFHKDVDEALYEKMKESLKFKKSWSGELKKLKKNGNVFWVSSTIQPRFQGKELIGYDVIMHDITSKKINEELMITDGLTHIYNRRHFNDIFPRMIRSVKRDGGYLSFLLLDVDNFKAYNDNYGHHAGDLALIAIANTLQTSVHRPDDYCFRLGGEEFAVLYKSANENEAYLFAQKFRKKITELHIEHKYNATYNILTASFGLVTLRDDELEDEEAVYKQADEYLYRAKEEGRNKVVSRIL
ncbi:MAG: diguanylate cyclase [Helicobacteraceae bacterium]|nr:diguanylate cyclase [Helicobacteraceae bacterium]